MTVRKTVRRRIGCSLVLAAVVIGLSGPPAAGQVKVGESVRATIESEPLPRRDERGAAWTYTLRHAGATFLRVHVRRLALGPADELRLVDNTGQVVRTYRGQMARYRFWAPVVDGDQVTLELHAGESENTPAVVIDRYAHGGTPLRAMIARSICGANEAEDVECYAGTDIGATSRAVGLLIFEQDGIHFACSGFLISSQDHLLTNEHCLSTQEAVDTLEVRFGRQARACGGRDVRLGAVFEGDRLIMTDWATDVALLTLRGRPSREYGYLPLSTRLLTAGEPLYLPQYPGADLEKVSVIGCEVATPVTDGRGPGTDLGHRCDTESGSSGAPVLDLAHQVVGLHHVGACESAGHNRAVLMSRIAPLLPAIGTTLALDHGTVNPKGGPGRGRLSLRLLAQLGLSSDGLDPVAEPFTLQLADADGPFYAATVPAGAFKRIEDNTFVFRDPSGSLAAGLRRVRIEPDGPGAVTISLEARGLDLSAADRADISIALAIGNDAAERTVRFRRWDRRWVLP